MILAPDCGMKYLLREVAANELVKVQGGTRTPRMPARSMAR